MWVKLQTSPSTYLNFRDAEKNLRLEGMKLQTSPSTFLDFRDAEKSGEVTNFTQRLSELQRC